MKRNIKIRLIKLGKTQRWLLQEVQKHGFKTVHEPRFSSIINGVYTAGYAEQVLDLCDKILAEQEKNNGRSH